MYNIQLHVSALYVGHHLWTTWWWPTYRAETCSCILYIATNYSIFVFMTVTIYRYIHTTALYLKAFFVCTGLHHIKTKINNHAPTGVWTSLLKDCAPQGTPWMWAAEFPLKKLSFNRINIRFSSVNLYALALNVFTRKDEMSSTPLLL